MRPRSLSFSSDDRWLAVGSNDGTVERWNLATSEVAARFRGHTQQVVDVKFSPDSRTLYSAGHDGDVRAWDVTVVEQSMEELRARVESHTGMQLVDMKMVQNSEWSRGEGAKNSQ